MMKLRILLFLALPLVVAACQSTPPPAGVKIGKPYVIDGKTYYPEYDPSYDEIGMASWYGPGFHGKYTANGEVFDQDDLTAAHPTLPMPSIVRVTNLTNGKSIILRINDRGPFKDNRIIDLSRHSAKELGIKGLAKVRVQFLKRESEEYIASMKSGSPVDVASFSNREEDLKDASVLQSTQPEEQIVESTVSITHAGDAVSSGVPLMTVTSRELSSPAPAHTPPLSDKKGSEVKIVSLVRDGWADDNLTMPLPPEQAEDAADVPTPAPVLAPAAKSDPVPKAVAEPVFTDSGYFIQVGSFSEEKNADKLTSRLSGIGHVGIDKVDVRGKTWWRVRLGAYASKSAAEAALGQVRSAGLPEARIIHQ